MRNTLSNKLIIISLVILVLLIFFSLLLGSVFKKKEIASTTLTPIPTQSFEQSGGSNSNNQSVNDIIQQNSLGESGMSLIGDLMSRLPIDTPDFTASYSSSLDLLSVSTKTPDGLNKFKQYLLDNGLSSVYNNYPELFNFTNQPTQQAQQKAPNNQPKQAVDKNSQAYKEQQQDINLLTDLFQAFDNLQNSSSEAGGGGGGTSGGGGSGGSWLTQYGNVEANKTKAAQLLSYIQSRWPTIQYAGNCSCRKQRGTGSNPNMWSIHSWCGAIDFFAPSHSITDPVAKFLYTWGNSAAGKAMGVVFALSEANPGDVHVQFIPNQQPSDLVPQCAGGPSS